MFVVRRVVGSSMLPALRHGQIVVAVRRLPVTSGDVVVIRHDGLEKIKRIANIQDGQVFVLGDNPDSSTDSRSFGWLPARAVLAKVVWPGIQ